MGEALAAFVHEAQGLSGEFSSHTIFSIGPWDISQYTLYMFIILAIVLALVLVGARKLQLIPSSKLMNTLEYGYEFVKNGIGQDVIGEGFKKHVPFLCSLFFFILICNMVGLIPGAKATTGSISITWALSVVSFVYFNFYGLKTLGLFGYIKSLCPGGVPGPMVPVIWFLEFFSMVIRVLTLAVRLYGNMLAGHMVLAVFSIATAIFIQTSIATLSVVTALPAVAWFALLVVMYALECLVAFLQAYVFTILSASYVGMAIHPH
ncbi:MAG: F0F1 ATP synthase subunit A [Coriobacteriaceae bacterium]|nr:F0F1 ATP synthase subunit A [Coriobacteriaceae bacterium]